MKQLSRILVFSTLFLFGSVVHADDVTNVLGEVDNIQTTIQEKTPPQVKNFFQKLDAWRSKEALHFIELRDAQDAILHPTDEVKPGTVTFNNDGNLELHTGIAEAKEKPKDAFLFYWYLILAFIFSTVYLFYSVFILIVLTVLKMLFGVLFKKRA